VPNRRLAVLLCGTLAILGCDEGERTIDRATEAARADSSAAGYAVGGVPAKDTTPTPPPVHGDTPIAVAAATVVSKRPKGEKHDSARTTTGPNVDSTETPAPPPPVKRSPLPVGVARVNEFLSYDAQARTATLLLVAGYNGLNDALNYNGGAHGSQGVSVPLGWSVHVAITNRASDLQHSAIVVRQVLPPPEEMTTPAFAGALVARLEEGVAEGDTTSFDFVADRVGRYMLACGVPGHAQGGMWMRFTVSPDIDRPAYR
jgi:sulfocyanin SoxE-like protein